MCSLLFIASKNDSFEINDSKDSGKPTTRLLIATFQQMKNPYQILIIPLTMWSGFEQGIFDDLRFKNKIY